MMEYEAMKKEREAMRVKFCQYCGTDLDAVRSPHHFTCGSQECMRSQKANMKHSEKDACMWRKKVESEARKSLCRRLIKEAIEARGDYPTDEAERMMFLRLWSEIRKVLDDGLSREADESVAMASDWRGDDDVQAQL